MSNDGKPFDTLGRILSEGGDKALANALSRGNAKQELLLLKRWFGYGASESDIRTVRGIAERAVDAGRQITSADPDSPINLAIIPINPRLFLGEDAGNRFYVSTDFTFSNSSQWYRADFLFPDLYSAADIISEVNARAEYMKTGSPVIFEDKAGNTVTMDKLEIQVVIGAF
jgi:hypothetical protein